ncbi:MAG TPA: MFS transporter [Dehalococcoidales bacterium]|nr:MFS transporter [Dehalococcoidales bacterium]
MTSKTANTKVKNSLKYSVLDGAAFSVMQGFTLNYITPFAIELKATTTQIGYLSSIPSLLMALFQLLTPRLSTQAGSRKGLILPVVFVHALMFIPLALLPFIFPEPKIIWLIALVTLSTVLGALPNPAWGSMMADLVPATLRGRYFGFRGRVLIFIVLISSLAAGGILEVMKSRDVFAGFAILFGTAAVFRLVSWYFLYKQYEPPVVQEKVDSPGIWKIVKELRSTNLGKFIMYVASINFVVMISSPFFAVYMLRDLQWSYTYYMMIAGTHALSQMTFQTFWGRRGDKMGNLMLVRVASIFLPFLPILYLASTNLGFLMCVEVVSGFAWAGFNLGVTNFIYDSTQPEIRTKQIAIFSCISGLALCFGALVGGYIAPHLPELLGYQLRTLFTISGVLRAILAVAFLRLIYEVRDVPKVSMIQFLTGR